MTGYLPSAQIDHKNRIRDDNRWENLRDVSQPINQQNKIDATKRSSTGLLGVSPPQGNRRQFKATIQLDGRSIHLGYYKTAEEAHKAYMAAKKALHFGAVL